MADDPALTPAPTDVLPYRSPPEPLVPRWAPAASVAASVAFAWLLVNLWLTAEVFINALPVRGMGGTPLVLALTAATALILGSASLLVLRLVQRVRVGSTAATVIVLCCCGVCVLAILGLLARWVPLLVYAPRVEPAVLWLICVLLLAVAIYGIAATFAIRSLRDRGGLAQGASPQTQYCCERFTDRFLLAVGVGIGAVGLLRSCIALLLPILRDRRQALPWLADTSLQLQALWIQPYIGWWLLGIGTLCGAVSLLRNAARAPAPQPLNRRPFVLFIALLYAILVALLIAPLLWAVVAGNH